LDQAFQLASKIKDEFPKANYSTKQSKQSLQPSQIMAFSSPSLSTTIGSNQVTTSPIDQGKKSCSYHRWYDHFDDECHTLQAKKGKALLIELKKVIKEIDIKEQK
jgi:hypothetical protein